MAIFKWAEPSAEVTLLSTEMNTLGNGSRAVMASAHVNSGADQRNMYGDFELSLATQGSARSSGAYVELYILPTLDGTNFAYGDASLDPSPSKWRANFQYDAATTARVAIIEGILLPNCDFKVLVKNQTGQAFAASGNTLTMKKYNTQSA